jgi:hypothetical protein
MDIFLECYQETIRLELVDGAIQVQVEGKRVDRLTGRLAVFQSTVRPSNQDGVFIMSIEILPELPIIVTPKQKSYQVIVHKRTYDVVSVKLRGSTIWTLESLDVDIKRDDILYRHKIPITEQHKMKFLTMYLETQ